MGISTRGRIQIYVCFFNPKLFVHEKWSANRYSLGVKFVGKNIGWVLDLDFLLFADLPQ